MFQKMCGIHKVAGALLLIGGLNWGLVGLLGDDIFGLLGLGMGSLAARAVYLLVAVSALAMLGGEKCCMVMGGKGEPPREAPKKPEAH